MNINTAFPSNFLKAADLQGRRVHVLIDRVTMEDVGDGEKPVLHFQGKERGLVLNKTNANMLVEVCGTEETERWRGIGIVLYPTRVDYQGKRVDAIRIDYPAQQAAAPAPPPPPPVPSSEPVTDDEIPF